ncbi:hypothetical protein lerEdw1_011117 [Lerista edwardsae]|nr:hypothetical protein lerEdw1_011117 [Lerista edwardsae]
MAHILRILNDWFWWKDIYIPKNCSWENFADRNGYIFPKPQQLYATLPYAFGMLIVRFFVERCIAVPLASFMGIKNKRRVKPQTNPTLEAFFRECSTKPLQSELRKLAKKCNWTVHSVEKWFRRRRNLAIPTVHKKFQEVCWRLSFYLFSSIAGFIFLYDKPWFHDIWEVWVNYPFQSVLPSQYWYYMMEMSFYWSLLITLGLDTKRKDFKAQILHHFAALALMFFSWSANYIRIGTLVMIVHDTADVWLEAAKLFKYANWERTCNVLFLIFAIVFFITRIILFPFWILRATVYYVTFYTTTLIPAYFFFNGMLLILQVLHLYWGYLIFKVLKKFLFIKVLRIPIPAWAKLDKDKNLKDVRSEDEEEEESSSAEEDSMEHGDKSCGLSQPLLSNNHH